MLAQVSFSPNASPTLNSGGWVYGAAVLLTAVGVIIVAAVVFGYMRFAPRFQREETGPRSVRAPRLQPGREAPRRPVNITGTPVVVPPPVAVQAPAAVPAPVAAPAPAAAPAPVPAAAPAPVPAAAQAAPAAGPSPAPNPAAQAAPAPAPAAGEHKEVALDQETFDAKLAELLAKGTDRRVAEGQARRAAMIAARKKAEA